MAFDKGDRVRIDIPDTTDIDHQFHGQHGVVTAILDDDAGEVVEAEQSRLFRVKLDSGEMVDVREWDVRSGFDEQ